MFNRNDFRDATTAAIVIAIAIALMVAAWFGTSMFRKHSADFRGDVAATESVKANGAYRIAAYDAMFNMCAEVQAKESMLAALRTELKTNPAPDRVTQINASLTAVVAGRAGGIARYNADARKSGTVGQFRDSHLPYQLDPFTEHTSCVA